jgi:cupin 2 domain-containing protein
MKLRTGNLREGIPADLPEELCTPLARSASLRIERIVSRGQASPPGFWYDQSEHEYVLVVQGCARLEVEGRGELELAPGDWLELPAHTRHRVTWTEPRADTIWLAVFYA